MVQVLGMSLGLGLMSPACSSPESPDYDSGYHSLMDAGAEGPTGDGGHDAGYPDAGNPADAYVPPHDSGTPDTGTPVTASPLTGVFHVNQYTPADQTRGRIAVSPSGNFTVAWDSWQQDGDEWGVVGRYFGPLGIPEGSEIQPQNNVYANQIDVAVARNSSGLSAMVWSSGSVSGTPLGTPDSAIMLQILTASGTPIGPNVSASSWAKFYPSVAVNEAGQVAVVWADPDPGWRIIGRIFDSSGIPLGDAFTISETAATYNEYPKVVAQPDGSFLVAWMSVNFTGLGAADDYVRVRRYSAVGFPMSGETNVIQGDLDSASHPTKLGVDAAGNGVVTAANLIRRISSGGTPLGDQIEFSSDSFNGADAMAVAPSGQFVMIHNNSYPASDGTLSLFDSSGALMHDPVPMDFGGTYATDAQLISGGRLYVISVSASLSPSNTEIFGRVFHVQPIE